MLLLLLGSNVAAAAAAGAVVVVDDNWCKTSDVFVTRNEHNLNERPRRWLPLSMHQQYCTDHHHHHHHQCCCCCCCYHPKNAVVENQVKHLLLHSLLCHDHVFYKHTGRVYHHPNHHICGRGG
jgi:hypothetical protein